MKLIRVLVVDDAVVVRRMLSTLLASDPALEVVGTAATGRIALAKIPQVNPDLITLDVEMPEMDGLQTLAAIRKSYPHLPVIMFSTQTERGAAATFDALALGANDYVTKPANVGSVVEAMERIREQLIPKIKLLCGRSSTSQPGLRPGTGPVRTTGLSPANGDKEARIDIVAIGASTGGPNALAELIPTFPANFPVPVVIVQHMPPVFTRLLAERLMSRSAVTVAEGVNGGQLVPGRVWIAPGDYHMAVVGKGVGAKLNLHQRPPENSCRPSADVLFRSVAESHGPHVLVVVLTGMGQDTLRGCEAIRHVGGYVLAQDESTSVVWGMPGFVTRAGLAHRVLPLGQMGPEILRRVQKGRASVMSRATEQRVQPCP
ncbi:MAG TPA: chemotaxis response regulator protein-glutamate methylesterase [Gemmataceae bacterium]|nr:chemotaxis response regulator protein-glutamate methylesterase [Gemmataceae bacterium]